MTETPNAQSLPTRGDLFDRIRSSCREVTKRAEFVWIDDAGLEAFAAHLSRIEWPEEDLDPGHHFGGDEDTSLAFTFLLDAINFGSGWFPVLAKRPGLSGYRTIASACREYFEREGAPSPAALRATTTEEMANMLAQDFRNEEVAELMSLFARAWREFGEWLLREHGDRFERVVEGANHSAEALVTSLAELPLYADVARYDEFEVPLFKRAQITVADLERTFGSHSWGRFEDLGRLTLFADNLVPHVLRCRGVLTYDAGLLARIDAGERLEAGSKEEVEIRAVAVEAVERLVRALSRLGKPTSAHALDGLLWNAGQAKEIKSQKRHRARSSFY